MNASSESAAPQNASPAPTVTVQTVYRWVCHGQEIVVELLSDGSCTVNGELVRGTPETGGLPPKTA